MQEHDKAYIAGFLDGEGCIVVDKMKRTNAHHRQHYYYVPRICIANRHKGVLDYINKCFGDTGSMTLRKLNKQNANWSDAWQLRFSSSATYYYLKQILPYLKMKQKQALLVIEMGELKSGTQSIDFKKRTSDYNTKSERYDEIYHIIKNLNRTGQEYFAKYGMNSGELPPDVPRTTLSQAEQACSEGATTIGGDTILSRKTNLSVPPEKEDIV